MAIKVILIISFYYPISLSNVCISWVFLSIYFGFRYYSLPNLSLHIFYLKKCPYNKKFCQTMFEICFNYLFLAHFIQINWNYPFYSLFLISWNMQYLNLLAEKMVTKINLIRDLIDFWAMQWYPLLLIEIRMAYIAKCTHGEVRYIQGPKKYFWFKCKHYFHNLFIFHNDFVTVR